MLDVKAWDDGWFVRLTGTDGVTVRKNLAQLSVAGKLAEVRVIVTEGRNDPEDAVRGIAATVGSRVGSTRLRLMRFRHFGARGEMANAPSPTDARMASIEREARGLGFGEVVVS